MGSKGRAVAHHEKWVLSGSYGCDTVLGLYILSYGYKCDILSIMGIGRRAQTVEIRNI